MDRFTTRSGAPDSLKGLGQALLSCRSIADLRALSPLPRNAQDIFDQAVIRVGLQRLAAAADIMAEGLTYSLDDPLSVLEVYWERANEVGHAIRTMSPDARNERQVQQRDGKTIPIYATIDDFSFGVRELRASERNGSPLDTAHVEQATRRVNEAIEDATINGAGVTVGGNGTPGLLNAPNVNTVAYVDNEKWDATGHSGDDILTDVLGMVDQLQAANRFGPYNLLIPTLYGNKLNQDFKANGSLTIRQRLEELEVGGRNLRIRVADQLPVNRTIMYQATSDIVDMIVGQEPTLVSWQDGPGWNFHFAVMAFMVPRVKDDYEDASGICTGNLT
jgi:uncharacterized linocin/CFP29 family protein